MLEGQGYSGGAQTKTADVLIRECQRAFVRFERSSLKTVYRAIKIFASHCTGFLDYVFFWGSFYILVLWSFYNKKNIIQGQWGNIRVISHIQTHVSLYIPAAPSLCIDAAHHGFVCLLPFPRALLTYRSILDALSCFYASSSPSALPSYSNTPLPLPTPTLDLAYACLQKAAVGLSRLPWQRENDVHWLLWGWRVCW